LSDGEAFGCAGERGLCDAPPLLSRRRIGLRHAHAAIWILLQVKRFVSAEDVGYVIERPGQPGVMHGGGV
jgi:hypothetical protein